MKNIINNIEREIEEQLDEQTEKNDFLTTNLFAIVKVSTPLYIVTFSAIHQSLIMPL